MTVIFCKFGGETGEIKFKKVFFPTNEQQRLQSAVLTNNFPFEKRSMITDTILFVFRYTWGPFFSITLSYEGNF